MNPSVAPAAAAPATLRQLARWLAIAQQTKDTATILAMNFLLLVPIAWPGLVLYALRWPLTRRHAGPGEGRIRWALTLVHEALCLRLFLTPDPDLNGMPPYEYGYMLGTGLAVVGLTITWLRRNQAAETAPPL